MRNLLIIGGICVLAIVGGVILYLKTTSPISTGVNANTEVPQGTAIDFKVLGQGDHAKEITVRKNYAIYDASEFANFWKKSHGEVEAKLPIVDFTDHYVIAVFAGTVPTGGYAIRVEHITDAGDARTVAVVIEEPGAGCSVIEEETRPYQFIVVPFSDAQALAHTDVRVKKDCP